MQHENEQERRKIFSETLTLRQNQFAQKLLASQTTFNKPVFSNASQRLEFPSAECRFVCTRIHRKLCDKIQRNDTVGSRKCSTTLNIYLQENERFAYFQLKEHQKQFHISNI